MQNDFVKLAEQIKSAKISLEREKQIKVANILLAAKGLKVLKDKLGK